MHIHVICGGREAKFWLEPEVELAKNTGIPEHKLSEIKKIVKKSSVISFVHIEEDLSSDQMFPMMIHAKKTARTYVEIASLPAYGSGYKGTIKINVSKRIMLI